ncbi:unnamed protein product [Spodoptera exigua]|nr:unnamed protein product [Spodoptera exigua]
MAQAEDTELRDLVIEALERNGSLAKIRALLRANIFLAFEDEYENLKQNVALDNILKVPEGLLALSVVHEFLEFCCLKNTLFVYKPESRQGTEYKYEGRKKLVEKMNLPKYDTKEPILLTLVNNMVKSQKKYFDSDANSNYNNNREEQNCTYILHEDSQSSTTSNSQSDNSSDEKNKLHLRLQLDNSDTDTSSDSARDKTSSEYVPGDHILRTEDNGSNYITQKSSDCVDARDDKLITFSRPRNETSLLMSELKLATNSSSDSTSYLELKPFNSLDEKMINTAGLPVVETESSPNFLSNVQSDLVNTKPGTLSSSASPMTNKLENNNKVSEGSEKKSQDSGKSDADTAEFSYGDDFSSSPVSKLKENIEKQTKSSASTQDELEKSNKNVSIESPHQTSQSSQSSVSLSDVADLISEKSSLSISHNKSKVSGNNHSKGMSDQKQSKVLSDDSGDFTESPVPSLSNLSLDIHSD